ncbi:hypothetical protein [Algoriphagus sp.]|uniref:hypothetical protein n=1 Tax=Algoriphagus sp. TaxID=1872435 RepID=UPI002601346B|nr:hypothetical protein [Algoriphagus sp.]
MKKYLLLLSMGVMVLASGCDPMNQNAVLPSEELSVEDGTSLGLTGNENARTSVQWPYRMVARIERNQRMMGNAYPLLMTQLPEGKVEEYRKSSRTKEEFVNKMVIFSEKIFDQNLDLLGNMLRHETIPKDPQRSRGDVILGFVMDEEAAADYYLKIPDIPGESDEDEFYYAKKIGFGPGKATGCDWCNDSFPPIKKSQLEETVEFLKRVDRWNAEPSQTQAGLLELEINSGLDPIATSLLLPAIQKVREAARIEARGKADILIESISKHYGIPLENEKGKFLRFGGNGAIYGLISDNYDESGDIDWASVQLFRSKFDWEMIFIWSRYWDSRNTPDPTTGR